MIKPKITTNEYGEKFILFFSEKRVNGVCSNFYPAEFEECGIKFNCVEQYMMYNKAMTFCDKATAEAIMKETEPKVIKKYGRMVKNYDDKVWGQRRFEIVKNGVYNKFLQNQKLLDFMIEADVDYFVECSPYDKIWGIYMGVDDPRAIYVDKWCGQNLLGKALKGARDMIVAKQ